LATEEMVVHYDERCWFHLYIFRLNLWM